MHCSDVAWLLWNLGALLHRIQGAPRLAADVRLSCRSKVLSTLLLHRTLGASLQQKRDYLTRELSALGFRVVPNHGTYFLLTDIRPLLPPGSTESDVDFAKRLTIEGGVTTIPVSLLHGVCCDACPLLRPVIVTICKLH